MAADVPVLLLIALSSWSFTGLIVLVIGGLVGLILALAIERAEVGYEDDSGYHAGTPPESSSAKKSSRPALPGQPIVEYSCKHSRGREIAEPKKKPLRHGAAPKKRPINDQHTDR